MLMRGPRRAYASAWVKPQPDPLLLAVTLLRTLEKMTPAAPMISVSPGRGPAQAMRRYGRAGGKRQ